MEISSERQRKQGLIDRDKKEEEGAGKGAVGGELKRFVSFFLPPGLRGFFASSLFYRCQTRASLHRGGSNSDLCTYYFLVGAYNGAKKRVAKNSVFFVFKGMQVREKKVQSC